MFSLLTLKPMATLGDIKKLSILDSAYMQHPSPLQKVNTILNLSPGCGSIWSYIYRLDQVISLVCQGTFNL